MVSGQAIDHFSNNLTTLFLPCQVSANGYPEKRITRPTFSFGFRKVVGPSPLGKFEDFGQGLPKFISTMNVDLLLFIWTALQLVDFLSTSYGKSFLNTHSSTIRFEV
jgi:hypothetical protein